MSKKSTKKSKPPAKTSIDFEEFAWDEFPFDTKKTEKCCIAKHIDDPSKKFAPNYYFADKHVIETMKYFLLDEKDIGLFFYSPGKFENFNFLKCLTDFMEKFNYQKKIYLRMFHHRKTSYCLSDDLLEIIPLVLKQQGTPIQINDARLQKLRLKWLPQHQDIVNTVVEKAEIIEVVRMFKLDPKLIHMIPDIEYDARLKLQIQNMTEYACYINRDGKEVVFKEQAIYHLYRECMCGINWNINSCNHPEHRDECKKMIGQFTCVYNSLKPDSQIALDSVKEHIAFVQNNCFFLSQKSLRKENNYLLQNYKHAEQVPVKVLKEVYEKFGLVHPDVDQQDYLKRLSFNAFLARMAFFGRWVSCFFDDDDVSVKNLIIDIFCMMMNCGSKEDEVKELILKKAAFAPKFVPVDTEDRKMFDDDDKDNYFDFSSLHEWRIPEEKEKQRKTNGNKDDGWNDYSNKEESVKILSEHAVTVNGKLYLSNHGILKSTEAKQEKNTRFFFLDATKFAKHLPATDNIEFISNPPSNLKTYSPCSDEFVVRSIQTRTGCYILTDEILELVPVLMKKQGIPVEKYEKKLKSYADNWKPEIRGVFNSVEVSFFKIIMDSLNVDRKFITIIPDPFHFKMINEALEVESIHTTVEDDIQIMCREQGMLLLFQLVVCGVNWKTKKCCLEKNQSVISDFRKRYNSMIVLFTQRLKKGAFVTQDLVTSCATSLFEHSIFTDKIVHLYFDYNYNKPSYDSLVTIEEHRKKCERFGIPENYQLFESREPPSVPMFIVRTYNHVESMEIFYPDSVYAVKIKLLEEIVLFLPKDLREKGLEYFNCIVRRTISNYHLEGVNKKVYETLLKEQEEEAEKTKNLINKLQATVLERPTKPKPPVPEESSDDNDPPPAVPEKPKKAKKVPKEPKPCNCTENGIALLNAREDLKKIEITAKSNEKRAKRTEKAKQILESTKLEMEALEKEIEDLRVDLKGFDEQEELAKASNSNILKDIEHLERQIELEAEKTNKDRRRNARLIEKFNEIQEEFAIRQSQREAQGKRSTVSSEGPSTYHVPFVPSLPTTDDPELALNPEWVLEQWRKMKSDFEKDDVVQEEKEMIESLLAICQDLHVKQLAEYELFQFEATSKIYLQNIELNILKIQKTGDISNMRPLAKYPSLSTEFWVEYGKYMGC
ncbi:unnamed protein product [Caenorhabditis brenneri]